MTLVAIVSMDQVWEDKGANFDRCSEFSAEASSRGCKLIIFPEMTLTGYSLNIEKISEYSEDSQTLTDFSGLAEKYNIQIVFGASLYNKSKSRPYNALACASPNHAAKLVYAKYHPFTYAGEDKVIMPGNDLGFINCDDFLLGTSVCYDLRFPVLYSLMAPFCCGAICIANWPSIRSNHWQALLVARAIENQMYMIGVNRIGIDGNAVHYKKNSMIVAPYGEIVIPVFESDELDIYDIDFKDSMQVRKRFSTLQDVNFERYFGLYSRYLKVVV